MLAITPPGTGGVPPLEDPDAYRPSRLAELVVRIADEAGVDRFAFMGHSWGASIGVHLAASHPERIEALILLDAGHTDVRHIDSREKLVHEFEAEQVQFSFESWDAFFGWARTRVHEWRPSLEPRYRHGMIERDGRVVARASATAAAWAIHGISVEQPSSVHDRLRTPTLLIVASSNDDADALERFRAAVPHALIEVVDSGHDVVEDVPDELVSLVAEWLNEESGLAAGG